MPDYWREVCSSLKRHLHRNTVFAMERFRSISFPIKGRPPCHQTGHTGDQQPGHQATPKLMIACRVRQRERGRGQCGGNVAGNPPLPQAFAHLENRQRDERCFAVGELGLNQSVRPKEEAGHAGSARQRLNR
jgi:hypothetical protein